MFILPASRFIVPIPASLPAQLPAPCYGRRARCVARHPKLRGRTPSLIGAALSDLLAAFPHRLSVEENDTNGAQKLASLAHTPAVLTHKPGTPRDRASSRPSNTRSGSPPVCLTDPLRQAKVWHHDIVGSCRYLQQGRETSYHGAPTALATRRQSRGKAVSPLRVLGETVPLAP